jgi:hypothetical protein
MNPRVTVGLLAVLVALGAYTIWGPSVGPASPTPGVKTPDPALDLWNVREDDIQAITVQSGGQEAGVRRADQEWVLTPSGAPADRLRVNSLVLRLASVKAVFRVPNPSDDAQYGLATPSTFATLSLANGSTLRLTIGGKAPAEQGTYVRKDGDTSVYLVSNALVQDLERLVTEPPVPPSPTPVASPSPAL